MAAAIGSGQQHVSALYRFKAEVKGSQIYSWAQLVGMSAAEVTSSAEALAASAAVIDPPRPSRSTGLSSSGHVAPPRQRQRQRGGRSAGSQA